MRRIKFIKNHKDYRVGDTGTFSNNEAFGLIDSGFAVVSKDMTSNDYKVVHNPVIKSTPRKSKKKISKKED